MLAQQRTGQKDRYVMLSPKLLQILREWWRVSRSRLGLRREKEIATAVADAFRFLDTLGYRGPTISARGDPRLGMVVKAMWISRERAREIQFLCVTRDQKAGRNIASLHVYRLPERTVDDEFAVNVFIAKERPELIHEIERLKDESFEPLDFLKAILAIYGSVLEGDARDIVEGARWDERYFVSWT